MAINVDHWMITSFNDHTSLFHDHVSTLKYNVHHHETFHVYVISFHYFHYDLYDSYKNIVINVI